MRRSRFAVWAIALLLGGAVGDQASGQFVVDRAPGHWPPVVRPTPPAPGYEVREVGVDARVRDGVAEVRVAQTFHNPGSGQIEAEYLFPLPDDAAVSDLVLMVDGRELPGRVLPKAEARRIYEEIVRGRRDPALLEYMGRGLFRAGVFPIPPGGDRVVTLRYTQVCRRERDVVEFAFPLAIQKQAGRPIGKLDLNVRVESASAIKSVYCPGHDARIARPGEREAGAALTLHNVIPTADFRLVYSLGEGAVGASLLSYRPTDGEDGYFLLLASPQVKAVEAKPRPKTVVFVIDRSGSMAGKKIEQARGALQFVLDNLRDDDTFDIVAYDDRVEAFKPELQRYSKETHAEATRFVDNLRPGGGTDIDAGLRAALALIPDDSRPSYVLFLTDGLPTNGERAELRIAENARSANKGRARIFSFGVGFDVNARLLDRLGGGSGGTSEYVRPDEDIEAHVGAFYSKLTRPALSGITIELAGHDLNRTYPRDLPDLFEGGQIAWVGRYPKSGPTTIRLSGKVGGERQSFEFPAELAGPGSASGRDFVAKLWAVRRVGDIIDQIDLNGPNSELTDELVSLSTRYGLLTPYTSFLADERIPLHARIDNMRQTQLNLGALQITQGQAGTMQRAFKQDYNQAIRGKDEGFLVAEAAAARTTFAAPNPAAAVFPGGLGGQAKAAGRVGAQTGQGQQGSQGVGQGQQGGQQQGQGQSPRGYVNGGIQGMGGGMGGSVNQMLPPNASQAGQAAAAGPAANVRRIGTKTFYRKNARWVDAEVKPEDEAKAVAVEQFGDEFFRLVGSQTADQNQYLTFAEPLTVRLGDRTYRVDPPAAK